MKYCDEASKDIWELEKASLQMMLSEPFDVSDSTVLAENTIGRLLGWASIYSLSSDKGEISKAYEIVTKLVEYTRGERDDIIAAADLVLSRVGNFPGRILLRNRHVTDKKINTPALFALESMSREAENTLFLSDDEESLLTDFQFELFKALNEEESLSVSAPTSAGKSFVLTLNLIEKLKSKMGQCIVYVVPTRALITEVSKRIRDALKQSNISEVLVRTAPFPVDEESSPAGIVYVLTQERLMSYIGSAEGIPRITSLIVDEAHEIQNGNRGVILESAIDIVVKKFEIDSIFFASPLIKNPSYFLSLFGRESSGKYFVETVSPVSQNIISISDVHKKPCLAKISVLRDKEFLEVGEIESDFQFRDAIYLQKANLAHKISGSGNSVIVFSNGPSDAEKIARAVAKKNISFEICEEILYFVDFLKKDVHRNYPLIECLMSGVAFHYGSMPSLVRSGVEDLFKNGVIKVLCCTSTLLQGVNLPAKHILIDNPKSGDVAMSRADFLNLAGRAGRLLHEFHGNIWCIRPEKWDGDCLHGDKLQEVVSAVGGIMVDGGVSVCELLDGNLEDKEKANAEAVLGHLYHEYIEEKGFDFMEKYKTESNESALNDTINKLKEVEVNVRVPNRILESHQSLRPDYIQNLFEIISEMDDLENFIPLFPYAVGAKDRMVVIVELLSDVFDWDMSERYRNWICSLGLNWAQGKPISQILGERVKFKNVENDPSVVIRECLSVLENAIRFKLVKYYSVYLDLMKHVMNERGLTSNAEDLEAFYIYLEFGSCNRNALNLMALGMSRFSALYLENKFQFDEKVESEQYIEKLKSMNWQAINMPVICRKEIDSFLM